MNVVEMQGISKYFGDFAANKDVDFTLREGEIHALLGENGAGKSTLMSVLYGLYGHEEGTIKVMGQEVEMTSPNVAIKHGIGMVHQHFMLVEELTVTENIFLGMKEAGFFLKKKDLNKQVANLNDSYGFNVPPASLIWQLSVGVQQKVEILKILMRKAKILILDEPTAVLSPQEVSEIFVSLKKLTKQGYSIILIAHKIQEVMENCDRITVMRDGKVIKTLDTKDTNEHELASLMVGREVFLERKMKEKTPGDVLFSVKQLKVKSDNDLVAVNNISFDVCSGEILGIAGIDGNGQAELGEAISGLRHLVEGSVTICGNTFEKDLTPKKMLKNGLAHIPDDRHKKGLVLDFSIKENLIMGSQRDKKYRKGIFMNNEAIKRDGEILTKDFDVRLRSLDQKASDLSGGNQQKVILARELNRDPRVILAIQPTRGLDVGAIEFIRGKLVEARNQGQAILLISTDLDEIRSLSDRIVVMHEGKISESLSYNVSVNELGLLMTGAKKNKVEGECNE